MKVSVAVCTYNGAKFIKDQLTSIVHQSEKVDEIVIVDDCSTDNTVSIINQISSLTDIKIVLHINDTNLGVVKNFEKAISLTSNDIIFLADQDDIWHFTKTEKIKKVFLEHSNIDVVFSDATLIDENSTKLDKTLWTLINFKEVAKKISVQDLDNFLILYRNVLTGACMAIRKTALDYVLPIPKLNGFLHDEYIGLQASFVKKLYCLNEELIAYRVHSSQASNVMAHANDTQVRLNEYNVITGLASSLIFYQHWKRRDFYVNELKTSGVIVPENLANKIVRLRKQSYLKYVNELGFFRSKKVLFQAWLSGKERIRFVDIFN